VEKILVVERKIMKKYWLLKGKEKDQSCNSEINNLQIKPVRP
jgi:hypothetical protein